MTSDHIRKKPWAERVRAVHEFHIYNVKINSNWRLEDTAKALNRSRASISDDLMLASWLITHSERLKKLRRYTDALELVRQLKRELRLRGFDD